MKLLFDDLVEGDVLEVRNYVTTSTGMVHKGTLVLVVSASMTEAHGVLLDDPEHAGSKFKLVGNPGGRTMNIGTMYRRVCP